MDTTEIVVAVITVLGVALSSGIIQFFVNRKDKKKEKADEDASKELREAIQKLADNDVKMTETMAEIKSQQDAMALSLVGQAHDRIIAMTDKITERGSITNSEKATIKSMYNPYKKLGGNGEVKEAVNYVITLPTITEKEARELDYKIRSVEIVSRVVEMTNLKEIAKDEENIV